MTDHERIWLEPAPGADEEYGRQWCQHEVWEDGVEYVRADLAEITTLRKELAEARAALEPFAHVVERAEAAATHFGACHVAEVPDDRTFGPMIVTWGDLRRAANVLRPPSKAKGEKK